jgi:hypothetical protein
MNILIGDKYYMKAHKIKVKIDTNLSTAAKGIDRSVVFMAFDGVPKLGFIINSKINNDFVSIALALEKVHVRSKVATFEPQINDIYFEQNVGHNGSFVSVLKQSNYEPPRPDKICKSGIVSATNSISVANAILLSHEISAYRKHFRLINRLVMAGGLVVAVALSILYCLGSYYSVSPEILGYTVTAFYTAEFLGTIPCAIKLTSAHLKHVNKNNGDTKQK